jgi:hypothetical protein
MISERTLWPNHRFEETAGKHSLPVPRGLRPRAAPQAERWASYSARHTL